MPFPSETHLPKEGSQRPWQARLLSASVLSWQNQNRLRNTGGVLLLLMEHHKPKFSVGPRAACGFPAQLHQLTPHPPPPGNACGCGELLPQAHS